MIVVVVLMNGVVDQAFVDKNISPRMEEVSEVANNMQSQTTSSEGQLSEDERAGLESMMEELEAEKERVTRSITSSENEIDQSTEELSAFQSQVDQMESQMGTIEKLNVFSREDQYQEALTES